MHAGETQVRLPRRLGAGIYQLRLLATTANGRAATDRMRVLGRPRIGIRYAKGLLRREFSDFGVGEGTGALHLSNCRSRAAGRRVRCRATGNISGSRFRRVDAIDVRNNGLLLYRSQSLRGRQLDAYAITP